MSGRAQTHRYAMAKAAGMLAVFALVAGFSSWASAAAASDAAAEEQIAEAERAASRGPFAADGVFCGSAEGFGGTVSVEVTVEDGYVDAVEVVDASGEDAEWLAMAIVLTDEIVEEQTCDLDVVSGATYTSRGILGAATEALEKSMAGEGMAGEG